MRIVNKKSHKKAIISAIVLAVIVAGATFGVLYVKHVSKSNVATVQPSTAETINLNPPTQEQIQAGSTQKQSTIDDSAKDSANSNSTPSPTPSTLTVTLTANNTNNGVQQLRYLINQQLNSGTCTLTLTNGSQTITKTASVQALASSSTCQGFDITTSGMTSGQWTAALTVTSGNQSGSTSSTFEV